MILGITACGVVKSITTSISFSVAGVRARPSWFSWLASEWTSWPRSLATSATSAPVLPRPSTKIFKRALLGFSRERLSCEYLGIYLSKERAVQARDYVRHGFLINHKSYINLRRALGDHVNVGVRDGAEYLGRDPRRALNIFAHQANDGLAAFIFHVGQLGQISSDGRDGFIGVHGDRNADLRGGNHVHRAAMVGEDLQDTIEKCVSH